MKNQFKKIEYRLNKFRKYPGKEFSKELGDRLLRQHPGFQSEKNFSWHFNLFTIIPMKQKYAILGLAAVMVFSGGLIWQLNQKTSNNGQHLNFSKNFLETAYAGYEKIAQTNLSQKIQVEPGKDFEDYLALFDDGKNENLATDLRIYGREGYVFNLISSPTVELFYENQKPILKINNQGQTKYFEYLLEKGTEGTTQNSWKEISPKADYNHKNEVLTLLDNLKKDSTTSLVGENEQEIIFSRLNQETKLPTGDLISEEYHFDKNKTVLLEKNEVVTRNNKKYTLKTEKFDIQETSEKNSWFFENENLISFSAEQYYYSGGANGYQYFTSFNYDKKNQKLLDIDNIFTNTKAGLEKLSVYSKEALPNILKESQMGVPEFIDNGTKPESKNFSQFNFIGDENGVITGMNIHFSEYQVAPGAAGSINLIMPSEKFNDLLNKNISL